jgi:glycosyltransferase involved in cell wall biosynthesis
MFEGAFFMKVALLTPCYYPFVRGNAVTVRRVESNLVGCGCEVEVFPLDTITAEDTLKGVKRFGPHLIHAFHGFQGGRIARLIAGTLRKPYVITLTGSDVYEALQDARRHDTVSALENSAAVVAFHDSIRNRLVEDLPELAGKIFVIAQGVEMPGSDYPHHGEFRPLDDDLVILLPAGLRPVKNVAFAPPVLARLHERGARLYFILVGPVLHRGYAAEVLAEQERFPFAHYFGEVGHNSIGWLYGQADVVLNTSSFEGGMSNAVLEAMLLGKAVLASNIEGNRSVIEDGVTGFLYQGESDFLEKLERLMGDERLRHRLGKNARSFVEKNFSPEEEAATYLELYEKVLAAASMV